MTRGFASRDGSAGVDTNIVVAGFPLGLGRRRPPGAHLGRARERGTPRRGPSPTSRHKTACFGGPGSGRRVFVFPHRQPRASVSEPTRSHRPRHGAGPDRTAHSRRHGGCARPSPVPQPRSTWPISTATISSRTGPTTAGFAHLSSAMQVNTMRMLSCLRHSKSGSNGTQPQASGLLGGGHLKAIVLFPMLYITFAGGVAQERRRRASAHGRGGRGGARGCSCRHLPFT